MGDQPSNFSFLANRSPQLAKLGALAEWYFLNDPPGTLVKLRQFAEFTSKDIAAHHVLLPSSSTRQHFRDNATGTAGNMPKISGKTLRYLKVQLPPQMLWDELLHKLDTAFARADCMKAEAARACALLDRLEATIFARAFRGELVPQDPDDEPTSTLLARIRAQREAPPKARRGRKAKADKNGGSQE